MRRTLQTAQGVYTGGWFFTMLSLKDMHPLADSLIVGDLRVSHPKGPILQGELPATRRCSSPAVPILSGTRDGCSSENLRPDGLRRS